MFFKSMKGLVYPIHDNQIVVTDIFKRVGLKKPVVGKLALEKYYMTVIRLKTLQKYFTTMFIIIG